MEHSGQISPLVCCWGWYALMVSVGVGSGGLESVGSGLSGIRSTRTRSTIFDIDSLGREIVTLAGAGGVWGKIVLSCCTWALFGSSICCPVKVNQWLFIPRSLMFLIDLTAHAHGFLIVLSILATMTKYPKNL